MPAKPRVQPHSHVTAAGTFPAFPAVDAPRASIVVPVFNHLDLTKQCLHAVAQAGSRHSYEVVVVDDGSSDGSAEWLSACPNLRLHRMASNAGFIGASNAGAAVARGEYLVFLNNDTEPLGGWLDALLETFDELPGCGLVGGKLIYPDGSLQEAGGIVFRNGDACNVGRGGDPADPRYDFVREVDYCSGACLAISRELFGALGGFDKRYSPAYYEDADLAFAVRAAGRKVIYQPRAEVVHYEGQTAGTDVARGVKKFQQLNRETFADKWRRVLQEQPRGMDFSLMPDRCATWRCKRRLLVMDASYPHADRDAGSMRMWHMLLLLRELGCHVMFWVAGAAERDEAARALERQGVEIVVAGSRDAALRWWYDRGADVDMVVLSRLPVALHAFRLARRYAEQAMLVFDTVDLHFLRVSRGAQLQASLEDAAWAEQLRAMEIGLIRKADRTFVVSPYEKSLLQELVPQAQVDVVSTIQPMHGRAAPFDAREGMIFLGNFEHAPNVDAAQWLIDEIMPRLRRRGVRPTLHIVGYAGSEAFADRACPDVRVHDFVADLAPIMAAMKIALAPLRYGAGVKGKINMAMSHGVPVVTTAVGAEGMELRDHHDALIADDADAFADAVVQLQQDEALWLKLSDNGLENVRRHFSHEVARKALQEVLARLPRLTDGSSG